MLALADQMTLLQKTWLDILYLNIAYRSAITPDTLVFSEDFKVSVMISDEMVSSTQLIHTYSHGYIIRCKISRNC